MKEKVFVGLDPGGSKGRGKFGWCVLRVKSENVSSIEFGVVRNAQEAVDTVADIAISNNEKIGGVGIDSPLFWVANGDRVVDQIVRRAICPHGASVLSVNSLQGACLAQGVIAALLLRGKCPNVRITESHPKALTKLLKKKARTVLIQETEPPQKRAMSKKLLKASDDELDAALAAWSAWQMARGAHGWLDIFSVERASGSRALFCPIEGVEYWMPIRVSCRRARDNLVQESQAR